MEEIGATNPKYQPLQVLWLLFVRSHSKTIPLSPIHLFTKQMVPSFSCDFRMHPIKYFLPSTTFASFFLVSFSSHTFSWACGSFCEPRKFSLFLHSLVCQITHSFPNGFQPNLCQHYSDAYSTCLILEVNT